MNSCTHHNLQQQQHQQRGSPFDKCLRSSAQLLQAPSEGIFVCFYLPLVSLTPCRFVLCCVYVNVSSRFPTDGLASTLACLRQRLVARTTALPSLGTSPNATVTAPDAAGGGDSSGESFFGVVLVQGIVYTGGWAGSSADVDELVQGDR